jgi:hypothetical protein
VDLHLRETRTSRRKFVRRVLRRPDEGAQEEIPKYFGEFSVLHRPRRVVHKAGIVVHNLARFLHR